MMAATRAKMNRRNGPPIWMYFMIALAAEPADDDLQQQQDETSEHDADPPG